MMTTDADVLALDPLIFRDGIFAARVLTKGTGNVDGATFTSITADLDFGAAAIDVGDVITIQSSAMEVVASIASNVLEVSGPFTRSGASRPALPTTNTAFIIATFAPHIRDVESRLLLQFGIEAADSPELGLPKESQIMNPRDVKRVVAWGVLHMIYAILAGADGKDSRFWKRSEHAREVFEMARRVLTVYIDTDQDGSADLTRRLSVIDVARS
jgi:hypothetical protein